MITYPELSVIQEKNRHLIFLFFFQLFTLPLVYYYDYLPIIVYAIFIVFVFLLTSSPKGKLFITPLILTSGVSFIIGEFELYLIQLYYFILMFTFFFV